MPKRILRRYLPSPQQLRAQGRLDVLGHRLHDPNLWHLNRRSVAGAVGVGLFVAFMPIPFQMLMAAILAIWIRVHLPLAMVMVWVSNPVTIPPIFYFAYHVGLMVTGGTAQAFTSLQTLGEFAHVIAEIWYPFVTGCLLTGLVAAALGYAMVRLLWRLTIIYRVRQRRKRSRRLSEHSDRSEGEPE